MTTLLVQCDRCGAIGGSAIFQGVLVLTGYSVSSDSRTRRALAPKEAEP